MNKIAITTTSFGKDDKSPMDLLAANKLEILLNPHGRKLKSLEVVDMCKDTVGIIAGTETIDAAVLKSLPSVKVISRCGTGMDNVDLKTAADLGIKVYNTPDAPTLPVAELAVGLILDLMRKISSMDRAIRNGKWDKLMGHLLFGKKIGIIGFGRIGQKTGELLSAFGTDLAYCDVEPKNCSYQCVQKQFEEILGWADIITIHASASAGCRSIIGRNELELMKRNAFLVNVSRGGMIDEDALFHALKEGHIAGAAIDVYDKEPYTGPLVQLEQVVLTPHVGSYAKEARISMELEAAKNLIQGLNG